jgi:hypothetical protein
MAWVVDTRILLDIALPDPDYGEAAATILEELRPQGLAVCPVTIVEPAPEFGGHPAEIRRFLSLSAIEFHHAWTEVDTDAAGAGWARYVAMKRGARLRSGPWPIYSSADSPCAFKGWSLGTPSTSSRTILNCRFGIPPKVLRQINGGGDHGRPDHDHGDGDRGGRGHGRDHAQIRRLRHLLQAARILPA